jgi:8-amino-7-oxononanoate synthase
MAINPTLRLRELAESGLLRKRRVVEYGSGQSLLVDGRTLINFSANDYLGLANDRRLVDALAEGARRYGAGSGASHLVSGHSTAHQKLEERLADRLGRERALLFSTGYMANLGIVSALAERGDGVVEDRLNHASLIDGALLAGARLRRFAHNDPQAASRQLERGAALLAVDGIFSMDGDLAPLSALAQLAAASCVPLLVDEAHAIGVIGDGRGSVAASGIDCNEGTVLQMGTLGKALGLFGAFVAGDSDWIDYLIQRARSYIYTTALPPSIAHAATLAVDIALDEEWRRQRLATLIEHFRTGVAAIGLPLLESNTPIQPLIVGDPAVAVVASRALEEQGLWVTAIRPPTVPVGSARLRITLSSLHREEEIDRLLEALDRYIVPLWRASSAQG